MHHNLEFKKKKLPPKKPQNQEKKTNIKKT